MARLVHEGRAPPLGPPGDAVSRQRSDKTEIRRLRMALRDVDEWIDGVVSATDSGQRYLAYARRQIRETLAPKRRVSGPRRKP